MSLLNNFDIAGSAMSAQSVRMNLTASNLANAESVSSSSGATYRARQPVFAPLLDNAMGDANVVGVSVTGIVEKGGPLEKRYEPDHPMANEEGYIFLPNVNVVEEMANMISASRSFQTNVEIVNTTKQMLTSLLRLGE